MVKPRFILSVLAAGCLTACSAGAPPAPLGFNKRPANAIASAGSVATPALQNAPAPTK